MGQSLTATDRPDIRGLPHRSGVSTDTITRTTPMRARVSLRSVVIDPRGDPMTTTAAQPSTDRSLPAIDHAHVADVMHHGVLTCSPDTPLREVAAMMVNHRVHFVGIVAVHTDAISGDHLSWSVVTDLDLMRSMDHLEAIAVASPITSLPSVASPKEPLIEVARRMYDDRVSHMIVVSEFTLRPLGVISSLDIARALAYGGSEH
jgi:CBS domain-containing protein